MDFMDFSPGSPHRQREVIQLLPITLENCHEREDGDLQYLEAMDWPMLKNVGTSWPRKLLHI